MKPESTQTQRKALLAALWRGNRGLLAVLYGVGALGVALNLYVSWLLQQLTDLAAGSPSLSLRQLLLLSVVMLGLFGVTSALNAWVQPLFYRRALGQYRDYAFARLAEKGIAAFKSEDTATYLSALTADMTALETGYLYCVQQLPECLLTFVGSIALMLWYSPLLTLAAVLFALLPVAASVLTGGQLPAREKELSDHNAGFLAMFRDLLAGFPVIKAFRAEAAVTRLFAQSNTANQAVKCRRDRTTIVVGNLAAMAGIVAQFGVFILGVWLALRGYGVTAGTLMVFINLMGQAMGPIATVPKFLAGRKAALALVDKLAAALTRNREQPGVETAPPAALQSDITVEDLTFGYAPDVPVLRGLNARFEAGKCYAVVGTSGSGKSTLLDLLLASRRDYTGAIRYGGVELRDLPPGAVYELVSVIQQEVFLFNASIRDNVTMFRAFPEDRLQNALHRSGLDAVIAVHGMDTLCGENGSGLSGGERQRVAIARSLLRQTPVLLADEATAALDAATAYAVTDAILALEGLTRVVVTHRMEAGLLARYDGILVLKNGQIVENGTFAELLAQKGYFYSLFTVAQ